MLFEDEVVKDKDTLNSNKRKAGVKIVSSGSLTLFAR